MRPASRGLLVVVAALVGALPVGADLRAQTPAAISAPCISGGGDAAVCSATAVAAQALLGHLGVASGLGSEVAGTASNLGQRLGTTPRLAFAARLGVVRLGLPDLSDASGLGETAFSVPTAHVDATVGLFDGFRIMPTVGGFLAVDLFGRASIAFLPSSEGFESRASALSMGARIGLFRESFTLPGVSVSVSRRLAGETTMGDASGGGAGQVVVDPAVTSVRATIGKDLFAFEALAGFGWDDYSGDATYSVTDGLGGVFNGAASLEASRRLYFVGASRSFSIVFLLSVEAGLAQGFDPVASYAGSFDPTKSSFFVSAAFRLTI